VSILIGLGFPSNEKFKASNGVDEPTAQIFNSIVFANQVLFLSLDCSPVSKYLANVPSYSRLKFTDGLSDF
jgi:hypothetical protein